VKPERIRLVPDDFHVLPERFGVAFGLISESSAPRG